MDSTLKDADPLKFQQMAYVMWYIWSQRNRKLHGENCLPPMIAAGNINHLSEEFNQVTQRSLEPHEINPICWTKPQEDLVKLNFDAAFDSARKEGGLGVVICDHEGFVLAAKSSKALRIPALFTLRHWLMVLKRFNLLPNWA